MADFNPDKYLANKKPPFDPDVYLKTKQSDTILAPQQPSPGSSEEKANTARVMAAEGGGLEREDPLMGLAQLAAGPAGAAGRVGTGVALNALQSAYEAPSGERLKGLLKGAAAGAAGSSLGEVAPFLAKAVPTALIKGPISTVAGMLGRKAPDSAIMELAKEELPALFESGIKPAIKSAAGTALSSILQPKTTKADYDSTR